MLNLFLIEPTNVVCGQKHHVGRSIRNVFYIELLFFISDRAHKRSFVGRSIRSVFYIELNIFCSNSLSDYSSNHPSKKAEVRNIYIENEVRNIYIENEVRNYILKSILKMKFEIIY